MNHSSPHARIPDTGAGGPTCLRFSNTPHTHAHWGRLVVSGQDGYMGEPRYRVPFLIVYDAFLSTCGFLPSMSKSELSELHTANAAASNITTRKLLIKDSAIACCTAACVAVLKPAGISMPTSLFSCKSRACCMPAGTCNTDR